MSVTSAVRRTADFFVRSKDDEVRRAVTGVIELIDPSGSITTKPGRWAVDMEERVLYYNRTFGGRPLREVEYMYLTFHEGGHLLFTQKCPIPDWVTKPKAFHKLWNACEDMRMERQVMSRFPGFLSIRNRVGQRLLQESAYSRMPDIISRRSPDDVAVATWLSAMQNEYQGRWDPATRHGPIFDPFHLDYHMSVTACEDTHPLYRKAAESPTMQSMMPYVEDIYRYLFPDEDTEGDDSDDEDEGEGEGEGEGGEGEDSDPTEGDDSQGGDDTEGDDEQESEGEGESEGEQDEQDEDGDTEGEGGSDSDDESDEDTEGEQDGTEGDEDGESDDPTEGDTEGDGDESDDTEGEDGDGDEGEGEQDDDSDAEGEGSGTEQEDDEPDEGEQEDSEDSGDSTEGEPEEMEPVNIFDEDDQFEQPPTDDVEPVAPDGAWREYVLSGAANRFSTTMRSMLRRNDDRGKRRNVAFGNLDVQRSFRMDHPIYDFNVFTRRVDPENPRYALIISVDTSGSMTSPWMGRFAWQGALEAAATLAEAWKQLRLPWTVFGWGSKVNYVVNDGSPGWQLDIVTTRGTSGGGTDEHVAILTALDLAMHYGAQGFQPIWFHISDGDASTTDQTALDLYRDTFGAEHMYFIGINCTSRVGGVWPKDNSVMVSTPDDLYIYMKTTIRRQVWNSVR